MTAGSLAPASWLSGTPSSARDTLGVPLREPSRRCRDRASALSGARDTMPTRSAADGARGLSGPAHPPQEVLVELEVEVKIDLRFRVCLRRNWYGLAGR